MIDVYEVISDLDVLSERCTEREGFVFTAMGQSDIYDAIVIRNPKNAKASYRLKFSEKSLKEHIEVINKYKIEKALIFADSIEFIAECPSLNHVNIIPSDTAKDRFDFSPIYNLSNIKCLQCQTVYGTYEQFSSVVDYSHLHNLTNLALNSEGHLNYEKLKKLEVLSVTGDIKHKTIAEISCSRKMKDLTLCQSVIESLKGIENLDELQSLYLSCNRLLSDISFLKYNSNTLRSLVIEGSPRILDFSCLDELTSLEHLSLFGKNKLDNLDFLKNMKRLKTFSFSMSVANNDLTPCLRIPYVDVIRGKKEYNLKNRDLPKKTPAIPFKIM